MVSSLRLVALAIVLAACQQPASSSAALVRVDGVVEAGPVCPVERDPPDPACAPRAVAGAEIVVVAGDGSVVARVSSDEDGAFVVELVPGRYELAGQPVEGLMGVPAPVSIDVGPDGRRRNRARLRHRDSMRG